LNTVTEDFRADDIIIAVMGPTGVGKSSFINHFALHPAPIGEGIESSKSML
jgi:putative ribosome biogenesis GTPase RsgA